MEGARAPPKNSFMWQPRASPKSNQPPLAALSAVGETTRAPLSNPGRTGSTRGPDKRRAPPTQVFGLKMGRSPEAIYGQASKAGISLKPTNQAPYGTKKPK